MNRRNVTVAMLLGALAAGSAALAAAPAPKPAAPAATPPSAVPVAPGGTGQAFGAWRMACEPDVNAPGKQACVVAQTVNEQLSRNVVFVWMIQYDDKGKLNGIFRTVSGVYVNKGLQLQVAANSLPVQVPYELCAPNQCQATFEMSADLVKTLSSAKETSVTMLLINGQSATVKLPMDGFAAATAALAKTRQGG